MTPPRPRASRGARTLSLALFLTAAAVCAVFAPAAIAQQAKPHELEDFIRRQQFDDIKISPTGEYLAATVPNGNKVSLVVLRRSDNKPVSSMNLPGPRAAVADFWWVGDERLLISASERFGLLESPRLTGEIWAVDADGSNADLLVGFRAQGNGLGSAIQQKKSESVAAFLIDTLANDDKNVLISVQPFSGDPYTRVDRMDIRNGRRTTIARAPVRNASFVADHAGNIRFASGQDTDLDSRLYYRGPEGGEWKLLNSSAASGITQVPLGFSLDNTVAYLRSERKSGPDAILAYDVATGETREVFRDEVADPQLITYRRQPVGVMVSNGKPTTHFFEPASEAAKLYRKLERAFGGDPVLVTSTTRDGKVALVHTWSDRNPGDYYLFENATNKADFLLAVGDWLDPRRTAASTPVSFDARDGLRIHGLLTAPAGGEAKNAPTVVLLHGGPFGIHDNWGFDNEAQMLAAHGYAVLQVNFRGSGNYGLAFEEAGRRQWGKAMQDDVTDATRWAIAQGIADPKRICVYGGSYGAYAALMGAAKEPKLYACAAGVVGVYDLPILHTTGDIQQRGSGETYINDWIGTREAVAAVSPSRMADRIEVPVLLAAGGEDERAPQKHTELMEKAIRDAGGTVEAHYYRTEGHGFYQPDNRRDFYARLLKFFRQHIGGREPVVVADSGKKAD